MFFKLVGTSSNGARTLFDGNCWKCLVNNLSNQANYLHAAAKKAVEACVELTKYAELSYLCASTLYCPYSASLCQI